ncbi:MAG: glycosyltransferase [Deltaproteobacteria bacterium]|nr:glycosyltransferase [Deltaproteobacteria bacterium]
MQPPSAPRNDLDSVLAKARLRANLDALARRQPALARELAEASPIAVSLARSGEPTAKHLLGGVERWLHSAYEPSVEAERLARLVPSTAPAVEVVGGGLGYLPARLLSESPARPVVLVEPDRRLLRTMLALFDLRDALAEGRLTLLVADESDAEVLPLVPRGAFTLALPSLAETYADRVRHLRFLRRRRGERGRVLAIAYKLLLGDIVDELEERGFAVRVVEASSLRVDSFRELVATVRPHAVFSMNWSPELALLATRSGVGYASWTIDPLPTSRLAVVPGTDVARCVAFAHRRDLVDELSRVGLASVGFLPLAAGRRRHVVSDPATLTAHRARVSFAGVSLAVEREGLVARLREHGADTALVERTLAWIAEEFHLRGAPLDYRGLEVAPASLPDWLARGLPRFDPIELVDRINGTLSHHLRMRRVRALLDEGIHVWGDEGWEALGPAYRGRAAHGEPLSAIYSASAVNLDVPRLYQRDIATMRVFDILACGGVLLTEPSAQILEMFRDGEHLFTYRDDAELVLRVRELAEHPAAARAAAERGRRLVLEEHLLSHRVSTIVEALEARGWFAG